jgi:anionic cell wall polymer biosynthesis LytR-Cps2A-Psr (LCP) family protein
MRYAEFDRHRQDSQTRQAVGGVEVWNRIVGGGAVLLKHWKVLLASLVVVVFGMLSWYMWVLMRSMQVEAKDLVKAPVALVNFVKDDTPQLKNDDGRVNILLLGIGGRGHDGPYLTDTIMVASIDIESGDTDLISLPRDIWVPTTRSKINAVYAYGFEKGDGAGLVQAKDAVEKIVGVPIHYGVRIDFGGFVKAVDLVDGVEVDVARAFVDYRYPISGKEDEMCGLEEREVEVQRSDVLGETVGLDSNEGGEVKESEMLEKEGSEASEGEENLTDTKQQQEQGDELKSKQAEEGESLDGNGEVASVETQIRYFDAQGNDVTDDPGLFGCRYEVLRFETGKTMMDGETALKFVRSRHGTNGEGSDFARADRQQRVIEAFGDKLFASETFLNPAKVTGLLETFGESIDMDIELEEYGEFVKLGRKVQESKIESHTISGEGEDALLTTPYSREPYNGAYVLVPIGDSWEEVHGKVEIWLGKVALEEISEATESSASMQ